MQDQQSLFRFEQRLAAFATKHVRGAPPDDPPAPKPPPRADAKTLMSAADGDVEDKTVDPAHAEQMTIFDPGPPRASDPVAGKTATSREAAESVKLVAGSTRRRIVDLLASRGYQGCTRDEIGELLHLKLRTVCPRVRELIDLGQIEETTERRKTESGRSAAVLVRKRQPPSWRPPAA